MWLHHDLDATILLVAEGFVGIRFLVEITTTGHLEPPWLKGGPGSAGQGDTLENPMH
jgi:hypothetical protein